MLDNQIRQHGRTEQSTSRRTLTLRVHQLEANRSHLETGVASTEAVIWTQSRFPATRPARAPTLAVLTRAHSESKGRTSTVPWFRGRPGSCRTAGPRHHHPRHHPASLDFTFEVTAFGPATLGLDSLTDPC